MITKRGAVDLLRAALLRARVEHSEAGYAQGLIVAWHTADVISAAEYHRLHDLLLNILAHARRPFPHKLGF